MTIGAFSDIKVLEYAHFVSGPFGTKVMAGLGAEVMKIEEPGSGDEARRRGPFPNDVPHPEKSGLFLYLNTDKLGITLNPRTSTGREIFKQLVKQVDVLVEDNPPGTMKELGLDYDTLSAINPGLIMASITPFGQTGPYRDYKAYHLNLFHGAGLGYLLPTYSRWPDREPLKGAGLMGDYDAGLCLAVAIAAAIYARPLVGSGQYIDISKQEALASLQRVELGQYPNVGVVERRVVQRPIVGGLVPCKDGYVTLTARGDTQWKPLMELMGNPDWAQEEWCQTEEGRTENADKLRDLMAQWAMHHTKDEIHHGGQAKGVLIAPVNTTEDMANSKQLQEREFFVEIDHPQAGKLKYLGAPYIFSKTPSKHDGPAPLLGQHNREVYCERLGYSKQELAKMREAGVI